MWAAIVLCQGCEKLQELVDKWEGPELAPSRYNLKLFADKETYEAMDKLSKLQNKNAHQLAMEVIRNFVASQQNGKGE
jgi:sulfite reductase (ferredoxin)